MPLARGIVQVYTGEGKGKTTAALGLAMRAAGHGLRVLVVLFMKGQRSYGELKTLGSMANVRVEQFGREAFVDPKKPSAEDVRAASDGLHFALDAVRSGNYDVVILDELNVALRFGLVDLADVLELLAERPPSLELVVTGRYAHPEVVRRADLVTEMVAVKHPFSSGLAARQGIEY